MESLIGSSLPRSHTWTPRRRARCLKTSAEHLPLLTATADTSLTIHVAPVRRQAIEHRAPGQLLKWLRISFALGALAGVDHAVCAGGVGTGSAGMSQPWASDEGR